jgi:short-subunit dehydrogenase
MGENTGDPPLPTPRSPFPTTFALVTGASSGIGLAISRELARQGYPVFMVSNEEEKIVEAAAAIEAEYKVKTIPLYADLAQRDSAQKLFDHCVANNIKVKILINNAGVFFFKDITDTAPSRIESVLNLHVYTPALLCRLFAEQMMQENIKGYILNVSSIAARMMMPGITMYSATKGFLRNFSRSMHHEVSDHGIGITTLCPGAAATGLYNLPPRYVKLGIRLGVIITPERLARLAVKKMFKRKAEYIPSGIVNWLFIFLVNIIPEALVRLVRRKMNRRR